MYKAAGSQTLLHRGRIESIRQKKHCCTNLVILYLHRRCLNIRLEPDKGSAVKTSRQSVIPESLLGMVTRRETVSIVGWVHKLAQAESRVVALDMAAAVSDISHSFSNLHGHHLIYNNFTPG